MERKVRAKRKLACTVRTGRVEERFRALVQQGNFYEAHQTMRALYQRYLAQGKRDRAIKLLRQSGLLLLQKKQWESGTEVCVTLVRLLREQEQKVTDELLDYIEDLFNCYKYFREEDIMPHPRVPGMTLYPHLSTMTKVEISQLTVMQNNREMFMKAALKWTSMSESFKRGHPKLHLALAKAYFEEGELGKSRYHLMYVNQPETLGSVLVELATTKGYSVEADMFITQAVLQLLVLENKENAYSTFLHYCKNHPLFNPEMPPPFRRRPLLNYAWFLILSLDIGDVQLFDFLCQCYTPEISRDLSYFKYIEKIRACYFQVKNSSLKPTPSGIFDLLMGGIGDMGASSTDLFSSLGSMMPGNPFGGSIDELMPPGFQAAPPIAPPVQAMEVTNELD